MDNKSIYVSSSMETRLSAARDIEGNREERFPVFDGRIVHLNTRRSNFQMGEIVKAVLNTVGITTYILGILTNLNNVISVLLGIVGFLFGIIKILHALEVWRMKVIDRKEKEDSYNKKSKL